MKTFQVMLAMAVVGGISNVAVEAKAQNPIVGGDSRTDVHYDPFNDHTYINRERVSVRESAFDPGRMFVDPGSERYVDRYFRDDNGELVREFGWTWTSYGRPHGKLTRQRIRHYPNPRPGCGRPDGGTTIDDRETVVYSERQNNGRPGNNPRRGGGTTIDDRETVVFDANRRNAGSKNGSNPRGNNRRQPNRNGRPASYGRAR